MAEHGDNYVRSVDAEGQELGILHQDCGHHCGAIVVGAAKSLVRHCGCQECHNTDHKVKEQE